MRPTGRLAMHTVPVRALTPATIAAMWRLYRDHYEDVDRATFDHDLAEKTLVFLGVDADSGGVVGFSTALFYRHRHDGRSVGVYFSGDTIIHPRYWGQTALHRCVTAALLRWKLRHPFTPLYWYLICSGFRTYLTLVRNFPTHWPHHERLTPAWEQGLIETLSRNRYGDAWKSDRRVISLGERQPRLKATVAPLTPALLQLPEIRFFVAANPTYAQGDELAMIALVDRPAVTGMAAKWLRRAFARRRVAGSSPVADLAQPAS